MIARFVLLAATALTALPLSAQEQVTVLRGARILPANGAPIENGVVVLVAGKVQAVGGSDTSVPAGAVSVDLSGRTITPGLVDAGTLIGVDLDNANEQGEEVTPHMRVVDALDPADKRFARVLRGGVTTVQVNTGNRNVIGGIGAVVKTAGDTVAEMLLLDESGMRLTMGSEPSRGNRAIRGGTPNSIYYRRPTTRMGVVWSARKAFYDAQAYKERKTVENGDGEPAMGDPAMEVLVKVLDREVEVHTTARAEQDIRTAIRLADEFGYSTLLTEAIEAWRVVDEIKESGATVLFSAPSRLRVLGSGAGDGAEYRLHTLNLLAEAEVPFAIQTGSDLGTLDLVHEAMFAVRNGLDRDTALAAVTTIPARILGIDDRVGAIAAGLDADLVVWSGDPFEPTSRVESVYVNGEEAY